MPSKTRLPRCRPQYYNGTYSAFCLHSASTRRLVDPVPAHPSACYNGACLEAGFKVLFAFPSDECTMHRIEAEAKQEETWVGRPQRRGCTHYAGRAWLGLRPCPIYLASSSPSTDPFLLVSPMNTPFRVRRCDNTLPCTRLLKAKDEEQIAFGFFHFTGR